MEGKGIGTVKSGISCYSNTRDIYSVNSPSKPNLEPIDLRAYGITPDDDLEQRILARLRKSKVSNRIKTVLKYICIGIFTPFYFLFYCIPKLVWDNALHPIVRAIIRFFTPPVQATIAFLKRVWNRIRQFLLRRQEQLQRLWQACVNAITKAAHRFLVPIRDWIYDKSRKIQNSFLRLFQAISNPIVAFINRIKDKIHSKYLAITKAQEKKLQNLTDSVSSTGQTVIASATNKIYSVGNMSYRAFLAGGLWVNHFIQYSVACFTVIPKYLFQISQEISEELRQWFSFR